VTIRPSSAMTVGDTWWVPEPSIPSAYAASMDEPLRIPADRAGRPHTPADAATAARAAVIIAYAVALVGAAGATLALREGEVVAALLVLTSTLGVAALLAATGTLLRGLRDVERRLRRLEDAVDSASR
jgi:hypothetical protein